MRAWITVALLTALALSGCADTTDQNPELEMVDEAPASADANETANVTTPAPVPVALNATVSNLTVEAGAPLAIMVNGTGDNLTWIILIDDDEVANGTDLPATLNHTFPTAGIYMLNVTLTDGAQNDTASFEIEVLESGPCGDEERCVIGEDPDTVFWSDGICEAKDEVGHAAVGWSYVPLTEVNGVPIPGGLWVYDETNGMPGLQLHSDDTPGCVNGDSIVV